MEKIKSIPTSWYTDPLILEKEKDRIFESEWIFVGIGSQIPDIGNYFRFNLLNLSIIIVRESDSRINGFINACRHRGATLVNEDSGSFKSECISCPYHGWTYNLNGSLRKAPKFTDIEDLNIKTFGLIPVGIYYLNNLIFIKIKDGGGDPPRLKFKLDNYHYFKTINLTIGCNWKVFIDNFNECYHCSLLHPLFRRDYDLEKYLVTCSNKVIEHRCPIKSKSDLLGTKDGEWLFVWPNLCISVYENYYDMIQIIPLTFNKTKLIINYHGFQGTPLETLETLINGISSQTFTEDLAICERVQQGLETGYANPGPLHSEREKGVIYFQTLIRGKMG